MKYLATLLLIGFMGILFIGFIPVHTTHHGMGDTLPCPIVSLINAVCGSTGAVMSVVHLSALQSLLNNPVSAAFVFATVLFAIGVVWAHTYDLFQKWKRGMARRIQIFRKEVTAISLHKQRSWISLFELSPAFI